MWYDAPLLSEWAISPWTQPPNILHPCSNYLVHLSSCTKCVIQRAEFVYTSSFTLGLISTSLCDTVSTGSSSKHHLLRESTLLFYFPEMPLHPLWTHLRQHFIHKIELRPNPFLKTPLDGCFPESSLETLWGNKKRQQEKLSKNF